jgi:molybdopterin molybdotransferase
VVGESLAGKPFGLVLAPGQSIRIMTGAVVPAGADAVVPVELTSGFAGTVVELRAAVRAGQHVRKLGSEVQAGAELVAAGTWIRAAEIGALAVLGQAEVVVRQRPRVAILATGDEVVPVTEVPAEHQVRESNSWAMAAQVAECGGEALRLGVAPDEATALRAALAQGLRQADVLVTIGGISKGTHDLVHGTLAEFGVQTLFHGIDLKPGKPTFFGRCTAPPPSRARWVFGLPGNPASSFTVFDLLVRPLLLALLGRDPGVWSTQLPWRGTPWQTNSRLQAVPARLRFDATGAHADLAAPSPSGDPFSVAGRDGYVLVAGNAVAQPGPIAFVRGSSGVQQP